MEESKASEEDGSYKTEKRKRISLLLTSKRFYVAYATISNVYKNMDYSFK
jgi:hypothetical protein